MNVRGRLCYFYYFRRNLAMRKTIKKIAATFAACTLAFVMAAGVPATLAEAGVDCSKAGKKAGKAEVDLDGTYHAYFGFQQSDTWIFRDAWYNPATGLDGKNMKDLDYNTMMQSKDNKVSNVDGTVTDAEIKGNGTYTVSVKGLNGELDPNAKINMVYASTDIPSSAMDTIKISDVSISIDGLKKWTGDPYINPDAEEWGLYQFDIVNAYKENEFESPAIGTPNDSIEITFTVSGMNSDNPDAVAPSSEGTSSSADAAAASSTTAAKSESGSSAAPIVIGVIVVIVIVAGVVVVVKKKKN